MKLRIDELANRVGTTSRNVRAYQARGLLPPPTVEGRVGYYDEDHLHRLQLIGELQERGFSLAAIRQTLDAWSQGGDLGHLLGLRHVLTAPWTDEQPATYTPEELLERFPEARERPELLDQAVEQGLVAETDDGRYEAPSPLLIDAGAELLRAGVPLSETLALVEALRADVADIADRFVGLVHDHLVAPITEGHATEEQVSEAGERLSRLRPIALEVVRPFLAQELTRATDEAIRAFGQRAGGEEDGRAAS